MAVNEATYNTRRPDHLLARSACEVSSPLPLTHRFMLKRTKKNVRAFQHDAGE